MLYIHEAADKVDFYPKASIYTISLIGDYSIRRNNPKSNHGAFTCIFPELEFRIETKHEIRGGFLIAPTIKRDFVTFDDVEKNLKGIKKVHFNECTKRLRLHYLNNVISFSGSLREKEYVFDDSEIKFNQTLSDFVIKEQEKWLERKPIKISDYVIINILLNLAINQDLKELRHANYE